VGGFGLQWRKQTTVGLHVVGFLDWKGYEEGFVCVCGADILMLLFLPLIVS
jgi:hypothetical protein